MKFENLIGQRIVLLCPDSDQKIHAVKLVGIETGGLWIESQELTNLLLQAVGLPTSPETPVLFLPYHAIGGVLVGIQQTALDEKALGV